MKATDVFTIHTDGDASGNPGPAAYSFIIERPGQPDVEVKDCLGETTNNIAEYTALVRALEQARALGGQHLVIHSDSELLVQQMNGVYQVKNEGLRPLFEAAQRLRAEFASVTIRHLRREKNSRADRLCNEALDGGKKPARSKSQSKSKGKSVSRKKAAWVREEALQCLRTMACAWARGNPSEPKPEDVWDQLWSILEEGGVLPPARTE